MVYLLGVFAIKNCCRNWDQDKTGDVVAEDSDDGDRGLYDALKVEGQVVQEDLSGLVKVGTVRHHVVIDVFRVVLESVVHLFLSLNTNNKLISHN